MTIKKYFILIFLLFAFHALNNISIVRSDITPITVDSLDYYEQSIKCYRAFFEDNKSIAAVYKEYFYNSSNPPLFSLSIIPFYLLFGISPDIACLANILFLALTILGMFLIGRHLSYGDNMVGVMSAFLLMSYPTIFGLSRWCMPSFAALSMVIFAVYFLLKSDSFANRKYSMLFGIATVAATLFHLSALFSIIPACSFLLLVNKIDIKKNYKNFFFAFLLIIFIIGGWLASYHGAAIVKLKQCNNMPQLSNLIPGAAFFIRLLWEVQLHKIFTVLLAIAALILAYKEMKLFLFLCSWYFFNTAFVSFFYYSWLPRFNLGGLAALALLSSLGIFKIKESKFKRVFVAAVVIVSLVQYFVISYYNNADKYYNKMIPLNRGERLIFDDQVSHQGLLQANSTYWHEKELIANFKESRKQIHVWMIYGKASIDGMLRSAIITSKLPIRLTNLAHYSMNRNDYLGKGLEKSLLEADYVITYKRGQDHYGRFNDLQTEAEEVLFRNIEVFKEVDKLKMPDGNILYVYKNTASL